VVQPTAPARVTEFIQIEDIDTDNDDFAPEPEQFAGADQPLVPNPLAILPYAPPLFITLIDKLGGLDNQCSDPKPADVDVNLESDKDLSTKRRLDFGSESEL
jgi:hypothetical protein